MKRLLIVAGIIMLAATGSARAQTSSAIVVSGCGTPPTTYTAGQAFPVTQDTTGKVCDTGGGGGGGTVNQGTKNAGGTAAWPISLFDSAGNAITSTLFGAKQALDVNVANGCTGVINISQTSTTDVHTFTNIGRLCSIVLISATAQNLGVDEGTGTACETNGTALIGVSSTSSATPTIAVAANGGFAPTSATPWLPLQASADHLCVLQSGGGNVSGTITYQDHT